MKAWHGSLLCGNQIPTIAWRRKSKTSFIKDAWLWNHLIIIGTDIILSLWFHFLSNIILLDDVCAVSRSMNLPASKDFHAFHTDQSVNQSINQSHSISTATKSWHSILPIWQWARDANGKADSIEWPSLGLQQILESTWWMLASPALHVSSFSFPVKEKN
jgi:hypothetical protein